MQSLGFFLPQRSVLFAIKLFSPSGEKYKAFTTCRSDFLLVMMICMAKAWSAPLFSCITFTSEQSCSFGNVHNGIYRHQTAEWEAAGIGGRRNRKIFKWVEMFTFRRGRLRGDGWSWLLHNPWCHRIFNIKMVKMVLFHVCLTTISDSIKYQWIFQKISQEQKD